MAMRTSNADERFGSASWADETALRRADMFGKKGLPIGFFNNRLLRLDGDAPLLTIGGAGSGKLRDLLARVLSTSCAERIFCVDPRGELYAISWHNFVRAGAYLYCWNPTGLHDNPQHRVNPLDILDWNSPSFHSDAKFIAESLIPFSGGGNSKYFEERARQWIEAFLKSLVEQKGHVDFPALHRLVNNVESGQQAWLDQLQAKLDSAMPDVVRTAGEMLAKQPDAPKEFSSVMGTIYANLGFLDDPALLRSLEQPDMSLRDLAISPRPTSIFLNVPIEFVSLWAPVLRTMFTVTMLYKARHPSAPRVTMITDEAGQMGRFEALLRSFTYGRGAGVRSWAIFQDLGQIARNYGSEAVQGFIGSAQMRQFFGVRDLQTAETISRMLGQETLRYDDTSAQANARLRRKQAALAIFNGANPIEAAIEYRHYRTVEQAPAKAQRWLMTPDE
ncbi:MAG: type IV secretory system conjugative DNA transfer family protein, partial [Novosphingobium sp.]